MTPLYTTTLDALLRDEITRDEAARILSGIVGDDGPAHVAAVIEEEIYAVEGEEF